MILAPEAIDLPFWACIWRGNQYKGLEKSLISPSPPEAATACSSSWSYSTGGSDGVQFVVVLISPGRSPDLSATIRNRISMNFRKSLGIYGWDAGDSNPDPQIQSASEGEENKANRPFQTAEPHTPARLRSQFRWCPGSRRATADQAALGNRSPRSELRRRGGRLGPDFAVLAPKRIRPTGTFENPEYGLAPCAGAVRLPKPVADLAWSAPGLRLPAVGGTISSGRRSSSAVMSIQGPAERTCGGGL